MYLSLKWPYSGSIFGGTTGRKYPVDVKTGVILADVHPDDAAELIAVGSAAEMPKNSAGAVAAAATPVAHTSAAAAFHTLMADMEALPGLSDSVQFYAMGQVGTGTLISELQRRRDGGDDAVDEALEAMFPELTLPPPAPTVAPPVVIEGGPAELAPVVPDNVLARAAEMEAANRKRDLQELCDAEDPPIKYDRADRKAVLVARLLGIPEDWAELEEKK